MQELLNRSTERLWGIVTNGLSLRLLRDNVTLTRQAYVEFDLEAIFATEAYEDFALLWLCAHQSRVEAETPEECWLERWTQAAQRDGTRALGELRSGVERAIEALGRGFLAQPANTALHAALRDGTLDGPAYYRELLRLVYRLLFLFVAEDRDALLLPDDGTPERFDARERYDAYYATRAPAPPVGPPSRRARPRPLRAAQAPVRLAARRRAADARAPAPRQRPVGSRHHSRI